MDEVDLAQVRLARIARDARAMLDRHALVRVALDTEPGQQTDAVPFGFVIVCDSLLQTAVTTPPMRSASLLFCSR